MNNIVITNNGLIEVEDLILIGSSTKRNDSNKIGMFGSGWKYALAWLLRNNIDIKIYSGLEEIKVSTVPVKHRTNEVDVITVNDLKTSLTTDMGPKWTGWMALREIVSNAIDEGGDSIEMGWNLQAKPEENITKIQISVNSELSDVMNRYEHFFAFNRKESSSNRYGRVFIKPEFTPLNVYRKGIRCFDDTGYKSKLDIDFNDINIDENRLTTRYNIEGTMRSMLSSDDANKDVVLAAMMTNDYNFLPDQLTNRLLAICKLLFDEGYRFTTKGEIELIGRMFNEGETLVVPNSWFSDLKNAGILTSNMKMLFGSYTFEETDKRKSSGIKYYLSSINCTVDVKFGNLSGYNTVVFNPEDNTVYIKDDTIKTDLELASLSIKSLSVDVLKNMLSD